MALASRPDVETVVARFRERKQRGMRLSVGHILARR